MSFQDKTLTCRDCGVQFVWTVGEQDFYASRGFTNEPSRCPECRAARKARLAAEGALAGTYTSGGYSAGGYTSGGYSAGGSTSAPRPQREMFTATCARCGGVARVPFQPRTDKPVYCSSCFELVRGAR